MNQILDHSGPKKTKMQKNPEDTRKIIKVYAILIVVFAICFIARGAYTVINNKNILKQQTETEQYNEPKIVLMAEEDLLTIEVSYNEEIEEVSYQWYRGNVTIEEINEYLENGEKTTSDDNDDEEQEDDTSIKALGYVKPTKGTGETQMKLQNIGIPRGDTTIHVMVRAKGNATAEYVQTYHTDVGVDKIAPEIKIELKGAKVIVTATDETEIDYVSYVINNGREKQIKERQDKKTIKTELELDTTQENNIVISAVDKAKNTGSYTQTIDVYAGVPKIEFAAEADLSKIYVNVSYAKGITKIEYNFNGEDFTEEFETPKKEYEFELDCIEGYNLISVKAFTEEEQVYAEDSGELEYNP